MDVILLAGGYATRLYPLTKNRPKALLPVAGKTILDHNVEALEACDEIEKFILVTNELFCDEFRRWADGRSSGTKPVVVLNDGTDSNQNRLGAVGDMKFALDSGEVDCSDLLYVAGTDNIAEFDITDIIDLADKRNSSAVFAYRYRDEHRLSKKGVVTVDRNGLVTSFVEKSDNPPSNLVVPPYYVYAPEAVKDIKFYLRENNNPDAPGYLLAWMVRRHPVYAEVTDRKVLDIGSLESYKAVLREENLRF